MRSNPLLIALGISMASLARVPVVQPLPRSVFGSGPAPEPRAPKHPKRRRSVFVRLALPPPRGGMPRPVKPRLCEELGYNHPLRRWVRAGLTHGGSLTDHC